jgi:hypothetical protein
MFEERGWFAEADARALRPTDSVNDVDHRGDSPRAEHRPEPVRLRPLERLLHGFPWHDRTQRAHRQRATHARPAGDDQRSDPR